MKHRMQWLSGTSAGFVFCAFFLMGVPVMADEGDVIMAVQMDPDKLAGKNLPVEEPFMDPEDVIDGNHRPRGEVLYYGDQLIMEVYADDPATFRFDEAFLFDEFVTVLSGKLILTATNGVPQEFTEGDSLVVPKGFTGTWQMLGNYRELVAIEREAYELAYGTP